MTDEPIELRIVFTERVDHAEFYRLVSTGYVAGYAKGRADAERLANGGWTPTYEGDMCQGGHPPQSVHDDGTGVPECGRCGRAVDRTPCGCGEVGHEALSRSFCPTMIRLDHATIARRVYALERLAAER